MSESEPVPICFFIGGLLPVYGILIAALGVYNMFPEHVNADLALQGLHADPWWSIVPCALGGLCFFRYVRS